MDELYFVTYQMEQEGTPLGCGLQQSDSSGSLNSWALAHFLNSPSPSSERESSNFALGSTTSAFSKVLPRSSSQKSRGSSDISVDRLVTFERSDLRNESATDGSGGNLGAIGTQTNLADTNSCNSAFADDLPAGPIKVIPLVHQVVPLNCKVGPTAPEGNFSIDITAFEYLMPDLGTMAAEETQITSNPGIPPADIQPRVCTEQTSGMKRSHKQMTDCKATAGNNSNGLLSCSLGAADEETPSSNPGGLLPDISENVQTGLNGPWPPLDQHLVSAHGMHMNPGSHGAFSVGSLCKIGKGQKGSKKGMQYNNKKTQLLCLKCKEYDVQTVKSSAARDKTGNFWRRKCDTCKVSGRGGKQHSKWAPGEYQQLVGGEVVFYFEYKGKFGIM